MIAQFKKILVLAPHIDDGEFGCGATLSKAVREGCDIKYIAFSDCKESLPEELSPDTLRKELKKSTTTIGINHNLVEILDFEVRNFPRDRQQILQYLIDIKKEFGPDLIFTPSTKDIHQDHQVITSECIRAYKDCTILGYELPWNCLTLSSQMIVKVSSKDLQTKVDAIHCYESQSHRPYHDEDYIRALALTRGRRVNSSFAESFEPIRIVL